MEKKDRVTNFYLALLLPVGLGATAWAVVNFPVEKISLAMIALSLITVCFSSYLRIQLPRTTIHLTISDSLVFLSLLVYGGEVAVLLAVMETAFTSINFRRQGVNIKPKTVVINVLIAAFSILVTASVVTAIFGSPAEIMESRKYSQFVWLLGTMALTQFCVNSVCVSAFIAIRNDKSAWKVWNEYCFNALVMYLSGAVMAGLAAKAINQIDIYLLLAVTAFFSVVYFTYRRYLKDVTDTAAKAELAERERAEQAELHVKELQHYVQKLELSGQELRKSHEQMRHAAYHDALTGLPNKYYFVETIKGLLKECRSRSGRPFAVLYLDLNRFKTINDSVGHTRGDKLISEVGSRLSKVVDENQTVGRFGGDEFAVLMPEIKNDRDVVEMADRITEALSQPFTLSDRKVFTSACIGIAFGDRTYDRAEDLLRDADIAMYRGKETRQKFVVFDEQMHARAVNLLQLEIDLRNALDRRELEVYYQPIVSLESLTLAGFEALIRWNHPTKGLVSPSEFISISESTDLIIPLTLNVLEESCKQVGQWSDLETGRPLFVSVNLSGKHFDDQNLVKHVETVLDKTGFDPRLLKLEITETAVMENADTSIEMLRRLKALGVRISIDDFGTGYSSLNYLHRFPLDTLKIDRSFVSVLDRSTENSEIVRTIVYLAKALDLNVVAEGIESIRQLNQLQMLGCEYGQGYLFSRPLPAAEIEAMLTDGLHWRGLLNVGGFPLTEAETTENAEIRLLG
jgi:diguanylate cyclase (GGDEF)-like protein